MAPLGEYLSGVIVGQAEGREGKEGEKAWGSGEVGAGKDNGECTGEEEGPLESPARQDFWRASGPQPEVPGGLLCPDQSMATLPIPHHTVNFS